MYCPKCGSANPDNAQVCSQCGESLAVQEQPVSQAPQPTASYEAASIPNYLPHSILVTMFCCQPLGIPAIVYAGQYLAKIATGDLTGAKKASDDARKWCWITFGVGLGGWALYMIFIIIATALGGLHGSD